MKKVVMFAGPYQEIPPLKGAAVETWIYEVSKRIIKYQMHIISINFGNYSENKKYDNGIFFHRIYFSNFYKRVCQKILGIDPLSYNRRIFKIIKKISPDIVHIHNYYLSHEVVKWIKNRMPHVKIIFHAHNEIDVFFKKGFPNIDELIGCSNYITQKYKSIKCTNKYKTIYNGVDIEKFSSIKENYKKNINSLFKKNASDINICYFGRISEEKGVDKFLLLAKELKNYPSYNFHLFGEISKKGDRFLYYKKLQNIARKENLNIKFHDYISPSKIHLAYHFADVVVIPSKFEEPFGMVALEALASKKPIIASKKGGLKEFLNEKNSFLIEDYKNFEIEAKKILLQYPFDKEIILNGYKTALQFDWTRIALETEKEYDWLVENS